MRSRWKESFKNHLAASSLVLRLQRQLFLAVVPSFSGVLFCSESVSGGGVEVELTCDTAAVFVFC